MLRFLSLFPQSRFLVDPDADTEMKGLSGFIEGAAGYEHGRKGDDAAQAEGSGDEEECQVHRGRAPRCSSAFHYRFLHFGRSHGFHVSLRITVRRRMS